MNKLKRWQRSEFWWTGTTKDTCCRFLQSRSKIDRHYSMRLFNARGAEVLAREISKRCLKQSNASKRQGGTYNMNGIQIGVQNTSKQRIILRAREVTMRIACSLLLGLLALPLQTLAQGWVQQNAGVSITLFEVHFRGSNLGT